MCRVFSGTLLPGQTLFVTQEEASGDKPPRTLQVRRIFRFMGRQLQVMADGQSRSMVAIEVVQVNADGQANASMELQYVTYSHSSIFRSYDCWFVFSIIAFLRYRQSHARQALSAARGPRDAVHLMRLALVATVSRRRPLQQPGELRGG